MFWKRTRAGLEVEPEAAAPRRRSVISVKRNASQLARAPGAVRGKSFIGMGIKLAGERVPLNGGVELRRIEGLEPRAKARQFARGKLLDGFFDVFGGGHVANIAFALSAEKSSPWPGWRAAKMQNERSRRRIEDETANRGGEAGMSRKPTAPSRS
jgi:hypothetical protein